MNFVEYRLGYDRATGQRVLTPTARGERTIRVSTAELEAALSLAGAEASFASDLFGRPILRVRREYLPGSALN